MWITQQFSSVQQHCYSSTVELLFVLVSVSLSLGHFSAQLGTFQHNHSSDGWQHPVQLSTTTTTTTTRLQRKQLRQHLPTATTTTTITAAAATTTTHWIHYSHSSDRQGPVCPYDPDGHRATPGVLDGLCSSSKNVNYNNLFTREYEWVKQHYVTPHSKKLEVTCPRWPRGSAVYDRNCELSSLAVTVQLKDLVK